jgi:hypothetical protein
MSDNVEINLQQNITQRVEQNYTEEEIEDIINERNYFNSKFKKMKKKNKICIFPNQEKCGKDIYEIFKNKKIINILAVAKTQSGKTGGMIETINYYINNKLISLDNFYIITGLSDKSWISQTKDRIPECLHDRIYHRNTLKEFKEDIEHKKNVLIFMDEIQIAAKDNQTITKTFQEIFKYDKNKLLENDIKIVEFSATPNGVIYDLYEWKENSKILKMEPGDGYISCFDLLNNKRVKNFGDLELEDSKIIELKDTLSELNENNKQSFYIILRIKNAEKGDEMIKNFKKYFKNCKYINYFEKNEEDINDYLKVKPTKNTFIFIKERIRCAKTLIKTHIGILYERKSKKIFDDIIIQGLIGRATGYDDNGITIIFTNIKSIITYQKLWDKNFDPAITWKSSTTKQKNGITTPKPTFNNVGLFSTEKITNEKDIDIGYRIFKNLKEAEDFIKNVLVKTFNKKVIDTDRKPDENGKYLAPETLQQNGKNPSLEYIKKRKWGLNETNKFRMVINDKDQWVIYWKISYLKNDEIIKFKENEYKYNKKNFMLKMN